MSYQRILWQEPYQIRTPNQTIQQYYQNKGYIKYLTRYYYNLRPNWLPMLVYLRMQTVLYWRQAYRIPMYCWYHLNNNRHYRSRNPRNMVKKK